MRSSTRKIKDFFIMAKASSINFQAVGITSEAHNQRRQKDSQNLLHKDRSFLNRMDWGDMTIRDRENMVRERHKKMTGKKMRKDATPIREGVLNITPGTRISDLKKLTERLEKEKGIKAFQWYIHRDEGRVAKEVDVKMGDAKEVGEFICNEHAHIIFDWTDDNTGKMLRLNKQDMRDIQDITAEELGMKRGKSSDLRHLNVVDYKIQEKEKQLQVIEKELSQFLDLAKVDVADISWSNNKLFNNNKENFETLRKATIGKDMQLRSYQNQLKEKQQLDKELSTLRKEQIQLRQKYLDLQKTKDKYEKWLMLSPQSEIEQLRKGNPKIVERHQEEERKRLERAKREQERQERRDRNRGRGRGR